MSVKKKSFKEEMKNEKSNGNDDDASDRNFLAPQAYGFNRGLGAEAV